MPAPSPTPSRGDLLEGLVTARYTTAKLERLEPLNARLDLLRPQIRLLHNLQLIDDRRYEHVARLVEEVAHLAHGHTLQLRRRLFARYPPANINTNNGVRSCCLLPPAPFTV